MSSPSGGTFRPPAVILPGSPLRVVALLVGLRPFEERSARSVRAGKAHPFGPRQQLAGPFHEDREVPNPPPSREEAVSPDARKGDVDDPERPATSLPAQEQVFRPEGVDEEALVVGPTEGSRELLDQEAAFPGGRERPGAGVINEGPKIHGAFDGPRQEKARP